MIEYTINSSITKQIKRLKKGLMKKTRSLSSLNSYSTKISQEFNKIKNGEIGEIFQNNIRQNLILE